MWGFTATSKVELVTCQVDLASHNAVPMTFLKAGRAYPDAVVCCNSWLLLFPCDIALGQGFLIRKTSTSCQLCLHTNQLAFAVLVLFCGDQQTTKALHIDMFNQRF